MTGADRGDAEHLFVEAKRAVKGQAVRYDERAKQLHAASMTLIIRR